MKYTYSVERTPTGLVVYAENKRSNANHSITLSDTKEKTIESAIEKINDTLPSDRTIYPKDVLSAIKKFQEIEECNKKLGKMMKEKSRASILPDIINGYYVPQDKARQILSAIKRGRNVLIVGPAGCGKSRLVQELAKHENKTLDRVNFNGGTTDASLLGEKGLKQEDGTITYFEYGVLPKAMKEGHWLLLDEFDCIQPEYLITMQGIFEGNGTPLVLMENGGEKIYPHPDFRIIATSNTVGRGDRGGYHGTNMLNIATLDRWGIVKMGYNKTAEKSLLMTILDNEFLVDKMLQLSDRIRDSIKEEVLPDFVFSTRRLIHWAESIKSELITFKEALELEILGRLTSEEGSIINEFVRDTFGI